MKLQNLKFIFMPNFWVMNYRYSEKWDKELNQLIDSHQNHSSFYFGVYKEYTCCINGVFVWINNYPYAYGTPLKPEIPNNIRPSRNTILRLKKVVDRELLNTELKPY